LKKFKDSNLDIINTSNTCAVIVAYEPTKSIFDLILVLKKKLRKIFIIDNSGNDFSNNLLNDLISDDFLKIKRNSTNKGIATALNQGVKNAIESGFDWVLTLDQDTILKDNFLDLAINSFKNFPNKSEIGAIGLNSIDSNGKLNYNNNFTTKDYLITSGMFVPLKIFINYGFFKESYFIDNVDLEFSLRIRSFKKKLLLTKSAGIIHKPGNTIYKNFFNLTTFQSSNHNSIRRFYMSRNNFLLSKEYVLKFPFFILKLNYFFLKSVFLFVLVEKNIKPKLYETFRGFLESFKKIK
jgi:rhamnosyltransferase